MPYVSLLYAIALLSYLFLATVVISRDPRARLNWSCGLFALALAIWSFEGIFHGNRSLPESTIDLSSDIGTVGRFLVPSLFLWFAMLFTGRARAQSAASRRSVARQPWPRILQHALSRLGLFGLPIFLMVMLWTRHFTWKDKPYPFGWVVVWDSNIWSLLFYAYLLSFIGAGLFLIHRYRRRTHNSRIHRQTTIIVSTVSVSLILGVTTDIVFPNILNIHFPELAGVLCLIWAGGLTYSIARLRLLITPQAAAGEILSTMRDAVILLSPERTIITLNQAALELSGYAPDELIGQSAVKLFLEAARFNDVARSIGADPGVRPAPPAPPHPPFFELAVIPREGDIIPVSTSARAMREKDGTLIGSVWVLRDITTQKEAEAVLRRSHAELEALVAQRTAQLEARNAQLAALNTRLEASEQRYRLLAENSTDVIWTMDLEMRVTYISPAIEAVSGFRPEELVGQGPELLLTPASLSTARALLGDVMLTLMRGARHVPLTQRIELESRRKNGTNYWAEVVVTLLRDSRGQPSGLLGVSRDITERRKIEEELRHYREHLVELVAERTRELQQAQSELLTRERLASLGSIAGSVAHELRNPLAIIQNAVEALSEPSSQSPAAGSEQRERSLRMIREQVERSDHIIAAILDFARNRPAQASPCRISAIISKAREQAALPAAVEFIQIVPEDLPLLYVDETQITQVLHNLITNAAQVMNNRGRITVECTVVSEEIRDPRLAASQRGPHSPLVTVSVTDTGPGIATDSLARIFEPFFTTRPQGIGLGLTICRSFVENNHGTITVASEPGKGTTFTVVLPAVAGDREESADRRSTSQE